MKRLTTAELLLRNPLPFLRQQFKMTLLGYLDHLRNFGFGSSLGRHLPRIRFNRPLRFYFLHFILIMKRQLKLQPLTKVETQISEESHLNLFFSDQILPLW